MKSSSIRKFIFGVAFFALGSSIFLQWKFLLPASLSRKDTDGDGNDHPNILRGTEYSSSITTRSKTNTSNAKPKLFLHVGPLKTGTTTIQISVLKKLISSHDLAQDNLFFMYTSWTRGMSIIQKSFLWLPQNRDMTPWNEFKDELDKIHSNASFKAKKKSKKQDTKPVNVDVIVSNEAFSFVRADEQTKASMRSLEEKWDVRVILAYRPLETWYTSLYYEDRAQTIFSKKDEDFRNWFPADGWNAPMVNWFKSNWVGSDPLQTYETYRDIFGKEKVQTLMLRRSDGIDISEQFLCEALQAKHSCEVLKRSISASSSSSSSSSSLLPRENVSSLNHLFDFNLLAMEALKRGFLRNNDRCIRLDKYATTLLIQKRVTEELKLSSTTIRGGIDADVDADVYDDDLPRVCLSEQQYGDLHTRAWHAEQTLAQESARTLKEFNASFQKQKSAYCSIDVDAILLDQDWEMFFRSDDRLCQRVGVGVGVAVR